jgi:putative transport protein
VRFFCRIDPNGEAEKYQAMHLRENPKIEIIDLKIENSDLDGMRIREILPFRDVIISRVVHAGKAHVALPKTVIHTGDSIRVVGTKAQFDALCYAIGVQTKLDAPAESSVQVRRMVVTETALAGRMISELKAADYGITVTRVWRGDMEFPGTGNVKIAYGDILSGVGAEEDLKRFARAIGDQPKSLNHPHLIPAFVCLALGVVLGNLPLTIPGIPVALKIGLAGGVLIAALLLSYVGKIGPLVWYLPMSGSLMLREIGISLFLACVGLRSGDRFVETFSNGPGLLWLGCGVAITMIPLLLTAFFVRLKMKMNYLSLCGLLSGCHTSPSTLAYANQLAVPRLSLMPQSIRSL